MNGARDELFTCSRFAEDADRNVALRDSIDEREDAPNCGGVADHAVIGRSRGFRCLAIHQAPQPVVLGAHAEDGCERIARVRITAGNAALGPNDAPIDNVDVVVMDDFLYAEPTPEPSTAALALFGMAGWIARWRRRA